MKPEIVNIVGNVTASTVVVRWVVGGSTVEARYVQVAKAGTKAQ